MLVKDTHTELARRITVTLIWIQGHSNVDGNEKGDELARLCSFVEICRLEPYLSVGKTLV